MAKASLIPKSKAKTAYALLSEVRRLILAEPLRYSQDDWLSRRDEFPDISKYPECGTIACVAGWVATLKGPKKFYWADSGKVARRILGIDDTQHFELFRASGASGKPQTKKHAESGAARIAAFQKKYRAQLLAKKV